MSVVTLPSDTLELKDQLKPRRFLYLPKEGLQGEKIPSYMLWGNTQAESIQIIFKPPLKFKEIFNVESYEMKDNSIIVKELELEGYVGLLFETNKVSDLEVTVPVKYIICLSNGDLIEEVRQIKLFRPQLEVNVETEEITINPDTGFVKGRIGIKNIGRGTLIMRFAAIEESTIPLETPPEYREFAEKFMSDLIEEMHELAEEFPQFKTVVDEMPEWSETDIMEWSDEETEEFIEYTRKSATVLASEKDLMQGFVEAYAKALAKNTEFIESIRRFIKVWESMVSEDVLLVNPFEEVVLTEEKGNLTLKISQTDKVFDKYDDLTLPKIELVSSKPVKLPVYRLFNWG